MRVALLVALASVSACSTSRTFDGGVDGASPVLDLDPVGRWESCAETWSFATDGSATYAQHRSDCAATGRWTVSGNHLSVAWDAAACGVDPATPWEASALRGVTNLTVLVDGTSRPENFTRSDATEVELLTLSDADEPTRRSVMRVLHDGAEGSGCYWSEDGACGGLLSCTGRILQWQHRDDGSVLASTSCTGDCPCGAVLTLSPATPGYAVAFEGVNCEGTFVGTASAAPRTE